jgi:hypothetical protein
MAGTERISDQQQQGEARNTVPIFGLRGGTMMFLASFWWERAVPKSSEKKTAMKLTGPLASWGYLV